MSDVHKGTAKKVLARAQIMDEQTREELIRRLNELESMPEYSKQRIEFVKRQSLPGELGESSALDWIQSRPIYFVSLSRAMLRSSTLTRGSPSRPSCLPVMCCWISCRTRS